MDKSPFPTGFLGTQLYYSAAWHDSMGDVDQGGVSVSTGMSAEGSTVDAARLSFTLQNPTGKYSPRNPASALYGLIGRGTPARSYVDLGAPRIDVDGLTAGAGLSTPDTVLLSPTGDLDLRIEVYREDWETGFLDPIKKWVTTGNQRSFLLTIYQGWMWLYWSTDGSTVNYLAPDKQIPAWAGRVALRATIDVNNGAGGHTVCFYYADHIDGTWIQLGEDVVGTGTTSIYNSTSPITLCANPSSDSEDASSTLYAWEMRWGIGGAVVTSAVVADEATVGVGTFDDAQGTEWTLSAGAEVTNRHYLAHGAIAQWPVEWGRKGAPSVLTKVEAGGPLRRLGQGASPVQSALRRGTIGLNPPGYWPCEDVEGASTLAPATPGARAGVITGTPTMATFDGFACSKPIPTVGDSSWSMKVPYYAHTGTIGTAFLIDVPASGMTTGDVIASIYTAGTLARVDVQWLTSGSLRLMGYNADGALTDTGATIAFAAVDVTWRLTVDLVQDDAAVDYAIYALSQTGVSGGYAATFASRTIGRVTQVVTNPARNCATDMAIGHITAHSAALTLASWVEVSAWLDEMAGARVERLCDENNVDIDVRGNHTTSLNTGVQLVKTLVELLRDVEAAEGGILFDDPTRLGLRYRTLRSLCSQPALTIPYTDNLVIPFAPTDDDAMLRNMVTVTRDRGTSATAELATGNLSTADVGIYDDAVTLTLGSDEWPERVAAWRLHLGTWDGTRFPTLGVDLAHPTFLADDTLTRDVLALAVGDRLVITDPPTWLPPDATDVLVVGRKIDITPLHAKITWTCVPARPYRVAYANADHRYDGQGTVLAEDLDTTETGIDVTPPTDVTWTHADGDYDIVVGGERMTVTGVAGNTLTVTRSVNGIVKTHTIGDALALADPSFYGL